MYKYVVRTLAAISLTMVATAGSSAGAEETASGSVSALGACNLAFNWTQPPKSGSGSWDTFSIPGRRSSTAETRDCTMKFGHSGSEVKALEQAMRSCHGINISPNTYFGTPTRDALQRIQSRHGLSADGVYGPATRRELKWDAGGHCVSFDWTGHVWA